MYIKENPASRLHDILTEIHRISRKNPSNFKFKTTWAEVLEVDQENLDDILEGIMGVQDLYRQTIDIIQNHETLNSDKNKKHLDDIYNALYTMNLQGNMNTYHTHVKPETLLSLSYIDELIEIIFKVQKSLLSEEEKEDLQSNIDELIKDLINSGLPDDLKSTYTNSLFNINVSLSHYRIYGAKGLQESLAKAAGELILNPSTIEHKDNKTIASYFDLIQRINMIVTTSETVIKLSTAMSKLIP